MISGRVMLQDKSFGERFSRLLVCFEVLVSAEGEECVRIEIDPMHDDALRDEALQVALDLIKPFYVGPRQEVGVGHDGKDAGIFILAVPRNSKRFASLHEPIAPRVSDACQPDEKERAA